MRWLLRNRTVSVGIRNGSHNSFEIRRSVVRSCRAVLLPRLGGPEVFEVRENVSLPELKPNEVLVRTRAVSVNPLDTREASAIPFLLVSRPSLSAIQLSVAVGCHVSTTRGGECIAHILAAGAEQAVDYTTEDYEASINGYYDAVLDTIGVPETE